MECQLLAAAASAEHYSPGLKEADLFSSKGTWISSSHHRFRVRRTPHTPLSAAPEFCADRGRHCVPWPREVRADATAVQIFRKFLTFVSI